MSFSVVDHSNDNARPFDSRAEAEDKAKGIKQMVSDPSAIEVVKGSYDDYSEYEASDESDPETEEVEPEVIDHSTDGGQAQTVDTETIPQNPDVTEDPVDWMPQHFVDKIQGVPTVNRKGYAVIASAYNVGVKAEPVVRASETEFEYAEFKAVAVTDDGTEYSGFGSAHIDRMDGDDEFLLNELAETRAMKRAVAWATGVGMTAMEEMKGEL